MTAPSVRGSIARTVLGVLLVVGAALSAPRAAATATGTVLVSVTPAGPAGVDASNYPSISADGRMVVFLSWASDLVDDDTNGVSDIFVRDLALGTTVRVSVASDGSESNGGVGPPAISADGRYVAFPSEASNLVPGDANVCPFFPMPGTCPDVFVHDLATGETVLASVGPAGEQANGESLYVSLSGDGRSVAFASLASSLTPRDRNGEMDVFVKDLDTGRTRRVSDAPGAGGADSFSFAPSISADGRWVAFTSGASNLVPGDRNRADDVFVRDLASWELVRVSVRPDGSEVVGSSFGPSISADGRFVAFGAEGPLKRADRNGLPDGYRYDVLTGRVRWFTAASMSTEPGLDSPPRISADGGRVVFSSPAAGLVPGDGNGLADVFVWDRGGGITLASVALGGGEGNGASVFPAISADGCVVAFGSYASDLAEPGGGGPDDAQVFARGSLCEERYPV